MLLSWCLSRSVDAHRLTPGAHLFAGEAPFFHYQNWRNRHWQPACRKAGITARPYDLRHTFASLRAQQGIPPHALKEWMGHSSITTTMNVYSHVYQEDKGLEALVERLYGTPAQPPTVTDLPTAEQA